MSKTFSVAQVAEHKKADDLWIIVDEEVYDLTKFQTEHPGKPIIPCNQPGLCSNTDLF